MIFLYVNTYTWPAILDKHGLATVITAVSLSEARAIAGRRNPHHAVAYERIRPTVRRGVNVMLEGEIE